MHTGKLSTFGVGTAAASILFLLVFFFVTYFAVFEGVVFKLRVS